MYGFTRHTAHPTPSLLSSIPTGTAALRPCPRTKSGTGAGTDQIRASAEHSHGRRRWRRHPVPRCGRDTNRGSADTARSDHSCFISSSEPGAALKVGLDSRNQCFKNIEPLVTAVYKLRAMV